MYKNVEKMSELISTQVRNNSLIQLRRLKTLLLYSDHQYNICVLSKIDFSNDLSPLHFPIKIIMVFSFQPQDLCKLYNF